MMSLANWFGNSGNSALTAFIISLVSILIAIAAMFTSWKTQKRIVEIEEAREKDRLRDMRKADLMARLVRNGRDRLIIENKGPAEAREISIMLNGRPLSEFPVFVGSQQEIHKVGPYSSFHYLMAFCIGLDPMVYTPEITINWTDDSGEPGAYQTTLTY
jgi:hypothetical protein